MAHVLVVGAGPAGMITACCLADAGIKVTILEQSPDLPDDLRASTFHPPTLDMLERFGVTDKLIGMGLVCPQWQVRDREKGVIATFDLGVLKNDTNHPYRLQCEQWRLTRLLRDRLATNPDVAFRYDAKVEGVTQDADSVTATISTGETFTGDYLVGSDGARSAVRRAMGIAFDGITIPEVFLTLSTTYKFHEAIPDLANISYISDPQEWFVLLRNLTLWRLLLPTDAGEPEDVMMSEKRIQERMQGVLPTGVPYEIKHRTAYRVHERVADNYIKGRVALVGDAAHVNNPLGGMGMNGGAHDAFNLGDKLVAILKGADPALLDRYERQRRKVALEVVQQQALRNRQTMNMRDPAAREAHFDTLRDTVASTEKHRAFLLRGSLIQSLRDLEEVA
ncbi:FAD-dependent monooxygenase [Rhodovarius crocodyli]|uniref:FAD-dependent monooxygenase n=1 Tax=Rhodovarius crocodyli TaxID=1979269 RepID=A0A437MGS1_9PROT|nr:NAD(P)/FAD-dependent oxidoreductase [Rhodovarius crocodyli]RVT96795.1 FAD-dependent monooxygenase [Rhodovarius crocodyli]